MSPSARGGPADRGYCIRVAGRLGPALHLALGAWPSTSTPTTTILRLRLPPGQGPAEAVATLLEHRLVLVSLLGQDDRRPDRVGDLLE